MKWVIYLLILILIPSIGIFYKCHSEVKRQLNIHSIEDKTDSSLAKNAETKYFQSSNNQKLAYWYFPVKNSKAVVILAHGFANPGGKTQMVAHAEYLKKAGYTTIIPDLRSFGYSEGEKIYLGTREWQDLVDTYLLVKSFPENKDKKIGRCRLMEYIFYFFDLFCWSAADSPRPLPKQQLWRPGNRRPPQPACHGLAVGESGRCQSFVSLRTGTA